MEKITNAFNSRLMIRIKMLKLKAIHNNEYLVCAGLVAHFSFSAKVKCKLVFVQC